jgi:polynucleotide 5'-hydroxyl-kinase GRC3/NOL9
MLQVLTGCHRLSEKAYEMGAKVILLDTSGLVDEQKGGGRLKLAKIGILKPKTVFALQRGRELEPWLTPLRTSGRVIVTDVACIHEKFRRSLEIRTAYRINSFKRYFTRAKTIEIDLTAIGVFHMPEPGIGTLVSFDDIDGFLLSLGIISSMDGYKAQIFAPISEKDLALVRSITTGNLIVDPESFEHRIGHPSIY